MMTVKNEAASLPALLESVAAQTRRPDEVVIVDGGSTDGSVKCVEPYRERLRIRLVVAPGVNIAAGRNMAIELARHEIVASTDAGCVLDSRWFEEILQPLEAGEAEVVAGWYVGLAQARLRRLLVDLTYPRLRDVDPATFLPSARSVAFTKRAWERAGRYPEFLETAEDTLFDLNLRRAGATLVFVPSARVTWIPRRTLSAALKQIYRYARGDTQACLHGRRRRLDSVFWIGVLGVAACLGGTGGSIYPLLILSGAAAWLSNRARRRLTRPTSLDCALGGIVLLLFKYAAIAGHLAGTLTGPAHHVVQGSVEGGVERARGDPGARS